MIKFIKEELQTRKRIQLIKNYTKPDKKFFDQSREFFLAGLKARGVLRNDWRFAFGKTLSCGFAAFFAMFLLTGGILAFSQRSGVAPGHPLYSAKILGENLQVKFAPPNVKPLLQSEFAQRRLEEMKKIKEAHEAKEKKVESKNLEKIKEIEAQTEEAKSKLEKNGEAAENEIKKIEEKKEKELEKIEEEKIQELRSIENKKDEQIKKLSEDFHEKIGDALDAISPAGNKATSTEEIKKFCETLLEKIKEQKEALSEQNDQWPVFNEKCGQWIEEKDRKDDSKENEIPKEEGRRESEHKESNAGNTDENDRED